MSNVTLQKVSQERIQKVITLYKEGMSDSKIRKELCMYSGTIKKILEIHGIKRSHADQVQRAKGGSIINHTCLDALTPEALYWIGFLFADGHIEKDRPRISLTIAEVDIDHLDKFRKFFGMGISIRNVSSKKPKKTPAPGQINFEGKHFRVAFSSLRIYTRLKELGFTHRKTYDGLVDNSLKVCRDFWRGCVDGDGWFFRSNNCSTGKCYPSVRMGLCGKQQTIEEFLNFLATAGITFLTTKPSKDPRSEVYRVGFNGGKVPKILDLLYHGADVFLDRKNQKYLQFVEEALQKERMN